MLGGLKFGGAAKKRPAPAPSAAPAPSPAAAPAAAAVASSSERGGGGGGGGGGDVSYSMDAPEGWGSTKRAKPDPAPQAPPAAAPSQPRVGLYHPSRDNAAAAASSAAPAAAAAAAKKTVIGDGGAGWRRAALKRATEEAQRSGRNLEEVGDRRSPVGVAESNHRRVESSRVESSRVESSRVRVYIAASSRLARGTDLRGPRFPHATHPVSHAPQVVQERHGSIHEMTDLIREVCCFPHACPVADGMVPVGQPCKNV